MNAVVELYVRCKTYNSFDFKTAYVIFFFLHFERWRENSSFETDNEYYNRKKLVYAWNKLYDRKISLKNEYVLLVYDKDLWVFFLAFSSSNDKQIPVDQKKCVSKALWIIKWFRNLLWQFIINLWMKFLCLTILCV